MTPDEWYDYARQDAARRGIPELAALLAMLRRATTALRRAEWATGTGTGADGDPTGESTR